MKNSSFPARRCFAWQVLFCTALAAFLVGCGPTLSPVTGTVTYKGEKVKGGMLIFSPSGEGVPASATIQEDGSFALKSGSSDGAILGKATVTYTPPSGEASTDPKKEGKASQYVGLVPKDATVEIKSGANTLNIELIRGK